METRRIGWLAVIFGVGLLCGLMPTPAQAQPPSEIPLVLQLPGMERAAVRQGIVFDEERNLAFDLYRPAGTQPEPGTRLPAVVFVGGAEKVRDWRWFIDYGRLAAMSGLLGIVPDKRYPRSWEGVRSGAADTEALLAWLRGHAGEIGLDPERICLWTFSAGGRLTSVGLRPGGPSVRCIVSFYGVLDLTADVAGLPEAERQKELQRYSPLHVLDAAEPPRIPLLVVRAGRDEIPGLNAGLDRFVASALRHNLPLTLINLPDAEHAFDGRNDTDASRAALTTALEFLRRQTGLPDPSR